ncbi:MAG TPA: phosphatidate cytidylyltransferase [Steroidobacteraceae bacterium]|nr:phosphatidate cytidylyltransferase [Steroidobacteraceae bacterium]
MLKVRILTALILGGLLLAVLFRMPPAAMRVVFGLAFVCGAWEWAGFGGLRSMPARAGYALVIGILLALGWRFSADAAQFAQLLWATCAWWVVAFCWLSLAPGRQWPAIALLCGVPVLVPAFVSLARIAAAAGVVSGPLAVLWLLFLVFGADIGAYFAGRRFGHLPLAPRVSPSKTWEGLLGGMIAVALIAWCAAATFRQPTAVAIGFGCAVGLFSVVGDLTESMFKRAVGLKDSGSLLPGHGGILDRIDSVAAAAPLYALGLFGSRLIS